MFFLAAVIWHWWLAPLLVFLGVVSVIAIIVGYLKQVSATRYPPRPKMGQEMGQESEQNQEAEAG